ncbi:MAG: helix-turn-helix domain-containing protein [Aliivibrio sp.]|uniref:helix-turn-helix domain-containing protein n=1 Tax=Aliivibrio sp. TaxID=1872443 RepID=UPI001A473F79|nr:helix-turn-helix domain-containing protein [Aliivibrio sp.]
MEPEKIKAIIREKGFSLVLIGEELGKTPNAVSAVINRHTTSTYIATAIAKIIGKTITEVFPDVVTYNNPVQLRNREQRMRKSQELRQLLAS